MSTPSYGTWDLHLWDGDSATLPVSAGNLIVSPTATGSIAGGAWTMPPGMNISVIVPTTGLSVWADVRALSGPTSGSAVNDAAAQLIATDNANYVAFAFVTSNQVLTVDGTLTYYVIASGDFASDFHEISVSLSGVAQTIYLDGVEIDTRAPLAIGMYPYTTFGTTDTGNCEVRGFGFATTAQAPAGVVVPPPPALATIHLGATGLTIDFDDTAHYDTQLTGTQVQHHNAVGRGLA